MKTIVSEYGEAAVTGFVVIVILTIVLGISIGSRTGFFAATGSLVSASSDTGTLVDKTVVEESLSDDEVEVLLKKVPRVGTKMLYEDLFTVTDQGKAVDYHIVMINDYKDTRVSIDENIVGYDGESLCFFRRGIYRITFEVYGKTRSIHQLEVCVI